MTETKEKIFRDCMESIKDIKKVCTQTLKKHSGICQDNKLPCCDYDMKNLKKDSCGPVFWNPYNQCVQCHNCGHVYAPRIGVTKTC